MPVWRAKREQVTALLAVEPGEPLKDLTTASLPSGAVGAVERGAGAASGRRLGGCAPCVSRSAA